MRNVLEKLCVEVTRASFYLGVVVFALVPLRWLFLTGHKAVQVIAVLLVLGLVVAWGYGLVLLVRRSRKTKPAAGEADQIPAEDQVVLQKDPRP